MIGLETAIEFAEKGLIPDALCRKGIQKLIALRLEEEGSSSELERQRKIQKLVLRLRNSPVAIHPDRANDQHYELPPGFFEQVLGKHLKYSCCYWPEGVSTLDQAEESALSLTALRAELEAGQSILELGCGWGSLSLWMAEKFPSSRILSMSNSTLQKDFVLSKAAAKKMDNLEVVTADINDFQTSQRFDRIVSVEMFEHVRNYQVLLSRIAEWLNPGGKVFIHIFSHRQFAYPFETEGPTNWMGRHFFTGGLMPSHDLLLQFLQDFELERQWRLNGKHYALTAQAWLQNMYDHQKEILPILAQVYGQDNAERWWVRWKLFFMACEELFGFNEGQEWGVSHYRLGQATSN